MNNQQITEVPTWTATIWIGRKVRKTGEIIDADVVRTVLGDYCDENPFCVSLETTGYIYKGGGEPGFAIGLINYPRFPQSPEQLKARALEIASRVQLACKQLTCSIVFPDVTALLKYEPGVAPWEVQDSKKEAA